MLPLILALNVSFSPIDRGLLELHAEHGPEPVIAEAWHSGQKTEIAIRHIPGKDIDGLPLMLENEAASAYADLLEVALREGVVLDVVSGYRTMHQQVQQHRKNAKLAAKPGWSNHQMGVAIDIENTLYRGKKTSTYWWLVKNAGRFGFQQPMSWEPWHWEYVKGSC